MDRQPRIFISAAEPSGDQHAAGLIRALQSVRPDLTFEGVAGPLMRQAGCRAIDDFTDKSAMLMGSLSLVRRALRLMRLVSRRMRREPADLAVLVDSPALHLPMAKRLKASGVPVLYYVAPQLWAWAPRRIRKVRRWVDRLAAILPFEEAYFRHRGVDATFVGHPLIEQLEARRPDAGRVKDVRSLGSPVVACFPGSRGHVIQEVLPGQIEVAETIREHYPDACFVFSAAAEHAASRIREGLAGRDMPFTIETGRNAEILEAADLVLCASGTATLEVAYHRKPMIVMYNHSKWGYRLAGRWLIRTPHLCLVNILAGREIVPEFMPYYTSTEPIAGEALDLLANERRRTAMITDLDAVVRSLGSARAAEETAKIALQMLDREQSVRRGV